jgi:hypothetical protein
MFIVLSRILWNYFLNQCINFFQFYLEKGKRGQVIYLQNQNRKVIELNKNSKLISYINYRFFVVVALLIKPKQQHGKNKNTGLFLNCMDFVVVCLGPA